MTQDYLRTCFRRLVRLTDGSNREVWVRWFFTPFVSKILPPLSAFASSVWEPVDAPLGDIGDSDRVLLWDKGENPGYPGLKFIGRPEWYANGLPPGIELTPLPRDICGRPTIYGVGGLELDGSAAFLQAITGRGGIRLNGSADFNQDHVVIGEGGIELGGIAGFNFSWTGQGGIELGGSADIADHHTITGSGGIELGGAAMFESNHQVVGEGGIELGGVGFLSEITTPCCPVFKIKSTIKLTFAVSFGSQCLCLNGRSYFVTYNPMVGRWLVTINIGAVCPGGGVLQVQFYCSTFGGGASALRMDLSGCVTFSGFAPVGFPSCHPLSVNFNVNLGSPCCGGFGLSNVLFQFTDI